MKDKRLTYILLPAVLVIWVIIGYRIIGAMDESETNIPARRHFVPDTLKKDMGEEYKLSLNYKDPFLKKAAPVLLPQPHTESRPIIEKKAPLSIPKDPIEELKRRLNFMGIISHAHDKEQVALVELDGKNHLVHKGAQLGDVTVKGFYTDSILIYDSNSGKSFFLLK